MLSKERRDWLKGLSEDLNEEEKRALRAILSGQLSKRKITPEQQEKMQAARKAKLGGCGKNA